ncbi:MAG: ribosomal protein S18-alanine N-acetyltransferase [Bacillota bacterium]
MDRRQATDEESRTEKESVEVYVRSMVTGDIPSVIRIERRCFPTPWSAKIFRTEIEDNAYADYIVALIGDEMVGYAGQWLYSYEAHVTNIAVTPARRGRHIGARLLLSLMQRAQLRGINRMTLEVRASNSKAMTFYRCYGFELRGVRHNYYTDTHEDAMVMACPDVAGVLERRY